MGLSRYNQKRDFSKTQEPKGVVAKTKGQLRFVVQKHAASHLHYDFRLEIDGVLVSWAVPKGPSLNPADRRLAMHVEDHPMAYREFEGTIPKGEYGGGTVMVWDIGTYRPEGAGKPADDNALMRKQLKERSIKIVMDGEKLKGAWHLFEMKDDQWLLTKVKDEAASARKKFDETSVLTGRDLDAIAAGNNVWHSNKGKAVKERTEAQPAFTAEDVAEAKKLKTFPKDWRPEKATLADAAFDHEDWIFEPKFDGYRALVHIHKEKVELVSRNGLSFNSKYPALVKAFEDFPYDAILDGEIVVEDAEGKSRFQWLQHIGEQPNRGKLRFYAFDILYFSGYDLRGLELMQRKKILAAAVSPNDTIQLSHYTEGDGIAAFRKAEKSQAEGIIAKRKTATYSENRRSKNWLKIKTGSEQEMVIGGFTEPSGSRSGLGALLCGYYDENGNLVYSGKVGTGFSDAVLKDLRRRLDQIERKTAPFVKPPREKGAHWVKPDLVAQLKFSEWTETGSMRHPVFLGLREDKSAKEVIRETATATAPEETENKQLIKKAASETPQETKTAKKVKTTEKKDAKSRSKNKKATASKVEISNPDKIFWPDLKLTKGDVIDYYDKIADYILPYLKDRPQSLRRTPNGIKDEGFFQKNVEGLVPDWVATEKVYSESTQEDITFMLCQNKDTLLYMANLGCIEINPWSSRVGSLDHPDYIIFDLDPQDVPTKTIVKVLLKLKDILDAIGVPAYVKTSGGKGIHVFIPVKPKYTYEQTKTFSHIVSQMVARELPDSVSLERMPGKRRKKVYLDFLQNGKGKTMASAYSLRPREGATASAPLDWTEIDESLDLKDYNIKTVPERLAEKGDLWEGIFKNAIDLKAVLKNLEGK